VPDNPARTKKKAHTSSLANASALHKTVISVRKDSRRLKKEQMTPMKTRTKKKRAIPITPLMGTLRQMNDDVYSPIPQRKGKVPRKEPSLGPSFFPFLVFPPTLALSRTD
jgi:hypothetical protein